MAIGGGASGPWGTAPMLMLNSRGKRFMNEGAIAQIQATCLRQPAGLACYVTDANWAKTLKVLRWTTAHPTLACRTTGIRSSRT